MLKVQWEVLHWHLIEKECKFAAVTLRIEQHTLNEREYRLMSEQERELFLIRNPSHVSDSAIFVSDFIKNLEPQVLIRIGSEQAFLYH